jgi:Protein of unknown function (DUF3489)
MTKKMKCAGQSVVINNDAIEPPLATQTGIEPSLTTQHAMSGFAADSLRVASLAKTEDVASSQVARAVAACVTEPDASKPKTTKQELVLTLLTQSGGATIDEIMQSTNWQQHSVRGFLAGTVRKRLGFDLTSVKEDGGERRYAIKVAA